MRASIGSLVLALTLLAPAHASAPAGMVHVPAGTYRPLYRPSELNPGQAPVAPADLSQAVAAFHLDAYPVTNAAYLRFVAEHPRWERSRVARLFADAGYLEGWAGGRTLGPRAPPGSPVVGVSWFAAKAYCKAQGKRLPNTAEWEYAASAGETDAQGRPSPAFTARILAWYSRPAPEVLPAVGSVHRNALGVHDMHGLVWEWTRDFNNTLVTGESRTDAALDRKLYCGAASIGAADFDDYAAFMRYAFRSSLAGAYTLRSLGFRCARSASGTSR